MGQRLERHSEPPRISSGTVRLDMPRAFGRLYLLKLLARGGMGDVYLAATNGIEGTERPCVVKTVRRDHVHDGSFLARFLDEARVQAQLNHPGVAQVLEATTDESGEPYTVVEYVEGRALSEVRNRAQQLGMPLDWSEAAAIALEVADALAHVHARAGTDGTPLGIVHRDLSPQNVMVGFLGQTKLIDFGTARGHNRRCHTVAGVVFAKPGYVAPEVARHEIGDGRIDLYALGIMLWELCSGKRFLTGDPRTHLEHAAEGKLNVPLIATRANAPELLDDIIQKLTANDPDERYPSGAMVAHDLGRLLTLAPTLASGQKGTRARIARLMRRLWPQEPARSRADFARLVRHARATAQPEVTPKAAHVADTAAEQMNDPARLVGTPYRLLRTIGDGASGSVYEAEHIELGRRLAIKVLSPEHATASDAIERFRREAQIVAKLEHPNVATLYDFGRSIDGRVFIAMELLRGETLAERLANRRGMDWREAVSIAADVAGALEAAHGRGLVHRDLKPQNLFLTARGQVKLLDFGIATASAEAGAAPDAKKGFAVFGTPEYMAPEQVAGENVDARADIYALGCVLYELVTGSTPFEGKSPVETMSKHVRELAEPARERAPHRGIPRSVEDIITTALAKRPDNRYPTAETMRHALEGTLVTRREVRKKSVRGTGAIVILGVTAFAALAVAPAAWEKDSGHLRSAVGEFATSIATRAAGAPPTISADARPSVALELPDTPADGDVQSVRELVVVKRPGLGAEGEAAEASDATEAAAMLDAEGARAEAAVVEDVTEGSPGGTEAALDTDAIRQAKNEKLAARLRELVHARAEARANPADARALERWAKLALEAGELDDAHRACDAWALRDGSARPKLMLARVLAKTGDREEAKKTLEEVIETHPTLDEARRMHAALGAPLEEAKPKSALAQR